MKDLALYTSHPVRRLLGELLAALNESPETLLVLNHPLWDEARIGVVEHGQLLGRLLERHGERIHALELNVGSGHGKKTRRCGGWRSTRDIR